MGNRSDHHLDGGVQREWRACRGGQPRNRRIRCGQHLLVAGSGSWDTDHSSFALVGPGHSRWRTASSFLRRKPDDHHHRNDRESVHAHRKQEQSDTPAKRRSSGDGGDERRLRRKADALGTLVDHSSGLDGLQPRASGRDAGDSVRAAIRFRMGDHDRKRLRIQGGRSSGLHRAGRGRFSGAIGRNVCRSADRFGAGHNHRGRLVGGQRQNGLQWTAGRQCRDLWPRAETPFMHVLFRHVEKSDTAMAT